MYRICKNPSIIMLKIVTFTHRYWSSILVKAFFRVIKNSKRSLTCVCSFCWLYAGLLARSRYSEGPATGHLDTGFSRFPFVYKQMLRWFPRFQVTTTCFSYIPPGLNLLVTDFIFCIHVK